MREYTIQFRITAYINRLTAYIAASRFRIGVVVFTVLFGTLFAIFWPVLIGGKIFAGQQFFELKNHFAHLPFYGFFSETLRAYRELPLWEHYILSGFPSYVGQYGFFHPLYILFGFIDDYIATYHWLNFSGYVFGAIFTYLFARKLPLSVSASLVVALVYIGSQKNITWADAAVFANTVFFIPLLFYAVLRIHRRERTLWSVGIAVIGIALGLLSAFIQPMLYTIVTLFFFALFLDIWSYRRTNKKGKYTIHAFRTTILFIGSILIGVLIISPWLLVGMNHIRLTERAGGLEIAQAQVNYLNFTDLIKVFFVNISFFERFNKRVDVSGAETFFVGMLPLLLIIVAFGSWRRNKYTIFFGVVNIFIFFLAVQHSPFYVLIQRLPVFNLFRAPAQWFFVSAFALAVLAGFGLERFKDIYNSVFLDRLFLVFKWFVFSVLGIALFFNVFVALFLGRVIVFAKNYFVDNLYAKTAQFPLDYYNIRLVHMMRKVTSLFSFTNYYFIITVLLLIIVLALAYCYRRGILHYQSFAALGVLVTALNFALVYQGYFQWLPANEIRNASLIARFFKESQHDNDEPFRIHRTVYFNFFEPYFELDDDKTERSFFELYTLVPNYNSFYQIESFDGLEHLASRRVDNLLLWVGSTEGERIEQTHNTSISLYNEVDFPFFALPYIQRGVAHYAKPKARGVLGMANVKYVISPLEFPSPWKTVYQTKLTRHNIPVFVMENPDVLPRVYFANSIRIIPRSEISAFEELKTMSDFKKETLLECDDAYCRNLIVSAQTKNDRLLVNLLRPGLLKVRTNTNGGRWLVYSETNLPTWEARIDGKRVPIYIANYVFQAIYVPPGEHEVELNYPGIFTQARYAIRDLLRKQSSEYLLIRDKIIRSAIED